MRAFICLIMTALLLNVPAFASEIWVFDPDEGAVVVNDDGSVEPYDHGVTLLSEENPIPEDLPAEDPAPDEPIEDPILDSEPIEDPYEEPSFDDAWYEDDEYPSYAVMSLNEPERSVMLDPDDMSMKDVVVMVLGEYSPRTQTVTQYLSDGSSDSYTEIVPGVAGMDWEWISGAALFAIVLFSFFKFVGVLLRNG